MERLTSYVVSRSDKTPQKEGNRIALMAPTSLHWIIDHNLGINDRAEKCLSRQTPFYFVWKLKQTLVKTGK